MMSSPVIHAAHVPLFPEFKDLELSDRPVIHERIRLYQPVTSELTFTNLYIWRSYYRTQWSMLDDWLIVINSGPDHRFALPPIGPPERRPVCLRLLQWLGDEFGYQSASIQRTDRRLRDELTGDDRFLVSEQREHFDYCYPTEQLIELAGRKLHAKRNHINRFSKLYRMEYRELQDSFVPECLTLTEEWCELRHCVEDLSLLSEWEGLKEALLNHHTLELTGGIILVDGKVEAVSLGEMLNTSTAVIHVEKANPQIDGLYTVINQQFAAHAWKHATLINREQDLGDPGLRKAKLSYFPSLLEEKFSISLTS